MEQMPIAAYRTFQITAPLATHWRPATCDEADCGAYANGWRSVIDERTDLGAKQAYYITHDSGRRFTSYRREDGLTAFEFEAGQRCFQSDSHRVPLERGAVFRARLGDHRGSRGGEITHATAADWVDDFATNQDRLKTLQDRG